MLYFSSCAPFLCWEGRWQTAQQYGLKCIDLYAVTEGHPEYYSDGLHPKIEGNKVIAEYIFRELTET